jgi:hypothetical protein
VSWSTKHQLIISLSTTESEYIAAAHAAKEALWLHSLIEQLFDEKLSPTTMFSNNQSTITLAKDHQYHVQTKHIDIQYHFIQWIIDKGTVRLVYCPMEDMCYALNPVRVWSRSRSGGVYRIGLGFSLCAAPLRYYMSEYFGWS